jgi:hypothetical protein
MIRKLAVTLVAATALLVGSAVDASASAGGSGLTPAQKMSLQKRVDEVLAAIPGGHQVSATEIRYNGLTVTFDPSYSVNTKMAVAALAPSDIICTGGWFCIIVRGVTFSFYKCQYWDLSNWWGDAPFKNNQSSGTVTRFYDDKWVEKWTSTAYQDGTVNVTPFWHMKVC